MESGPGAGGARCTTARLVMLSIGSFMEDIAMRATFPLVIGLLLATTWPAYGELPKDMPKRKPGLWEMKMSMPTMGGLGHSVQMCVGDKTDDLMANGAAENGDCQPASYRRDGNRVAFQAVCRIEGTTATTDGVFTGNFTDSYRGEMNTRYDPPLQGMSRTTMTQEARRLGPCKPGQKPGDVVMQGMPGMPGFNAEEMMKNMPKAPRR